MPRSFRSAFTAGACSPSDVLAFHRQYFGTLRMENGDDPQRPDGVSDTEWEALGDPGKRAIVRERERATKAEGELASTRAAAAAAAAKPAPPAADDAKPPENPGASPDVATIVSQAVAAALKPFEEREQQREVEQAASVVVSAVQDAAKSRLHDASDALAHIDLTTLVDEAGRPDASKITAALDGLVKTKPHLAKVVDDRRRPAPDAPVGGAAPVVSMDDRVKATLAKMQTSAGVKLAGH